VGPIGIEKKARSRAEPHAISPEKSKRAAGAVQALKKPAQSYRREKSIEELGKDVARRGRKDWGS